MSIHLRVPFCVASLTIEAVDDDVPKALRPYCPPSMTATRLKAACCRASLIRIPSAIANSHRVVRVDRLKGEM